MAIPVGHKATQERRVIDGRGVTVWVLRGPVDPNRTDPDDHTMPVVSHTYYTKRALLTAIDNGTAWLR